VVVLDRVDRQDFGWASTFQSEGEAKLVIEANRVFASPPTLELLEMQRLERPKVTLIIGRSDLLHAAAEGSDNSVAEPSGEPFVHLQPSQVIVVKPYFHSWIPRSILGFRETVVKSWLHESHEYVLTTIRSRGSLQA
jgi:hypothetical protein